MGALWIVHVTVTDEEAYMKHAAGATLAIAEHGGRFLVRGGRYVQLIGKERSRNVVAQFADFETAQKCYNSDAYQDSLKYADGSCELELMIVETLE